MLCAILRGCRPRRCELILVIRVILRAILGCCRPRCREVSFVLRLILLCCDPNGRLVRLRG
ncbi:MAG: hypothetical protein ACTHQQ_16925 [Solirubrobacteraceae bacterium]